MKTNNTLMVAILLVSVFCVFLLLCAKPTDPTTEYDNVDLEIEIVSSGGHTIGDTIEIAATVTLPRLVSSLTFDAGDDLDSTIQITQSTGIKDTFYLRFEANSTGDLLVSVVAQLKNEHTISRTTTVAIEGLVPVIDSQATTIHVKEGNACTLWVVSSGTPSMTNIWYKNGTEFIDSTSGPLIIDPSQLSDSGSYRAVVRNKWGTDTTEVLTVKVSPLGAPDAPVNLTAQKTTGSVILLWDPVEGAEGYNVYRHDSKFETTEPVAQTTQAVYTDNDPGNYHYWVTAYKGDYESLPSGAVFSGNLAPQWNSDSIHVEVNEGDSISIPLPDSVSDPNTHDELTFDVISSHSISGNIIADTMYSFVAGHRDSGLYDESIIVSDGELNDTLFAIIHVEATYCTLSVGTAENGSVHVDPSGDIYRWADTVTVTVSADSGFEFSGWSGDNTGFNEQITLTMDKNYSIIPQFTPVSECRILQPGESIRQAIREASASNEIIEKICPQPGSYDNGALKVNGTVKIVIRK
ncbi:MAG: hypothetical protein GF401_05245 [Chitinivibrionales bacterium]|nr:hypothetical protein [Chitinivibrionales bacterium]